MQQLIIFLHTYDLARPSWVVIDEHSSIKQCIHHGQPDQLTLETSDKKITVLVPAEDVLLTAVNLPKMSRSRLIQALPFALEEQLINDLDKLHFAPSDIVTDGDLPVAIVSVEKMQEWTTLLQSWQIQADILCPTSLALPYDINAWHVVTDGMAVVRTGAYQGFACDKFNLKQLLTMALNNTIQKPERIDVHHYAHQPSDEVLSMQIDMKEYFKQPETYFGDLAQHVAKFPTINLLQGAYRVKKAKFPQREKLWRMAAYLVMAWVCLLFFYPTLSYFILKSKVGSIEHQIQEIYKHQFPQSSSVVAPKLRMQEKLQKLNSQMGENKFLSSLGFVGKGMLATPSIKLKHLEFQNNQLTLELTAGSSEDIAKFADFLTQQGLNVKQQNANLTGARISATLIIL